MSNERPFVRRHLGVSKQFETEMLASLSLSSIDALIEETIPSNILKRRKLKVGTALSEQELLTHLRGLEAKNKVYKTYIGQGYYHTFTPPVIQRNILENPGWYTQYTPYQAEISQGRLEALLNFQTLVSDLTGLPLANASLLDEGTAAAEAMIMMYKASRKKKDKKECHSLFIDKGLFDGVKAVLETRAEPFGIELIEGNVSDFTDFSSVFGAIVQCPDKHGRLIDAGQFADALHAENALLTISADILALVLMKEAGAMNADIAVGSTQRLGVPMGYGGPHAAYLACSEDFKRAIPGRIIGVSVDEQENRALRMALQTREQHIKREKATSNICTAQALLAIMAGMYGVYHGPNGLRQIANSIHSKAAALHAALSQLGLKSVSDQFFDTVHFIVEDNTAILERAAKEEINIFFEDGIVGFSLDECTTWADCETLSYVFSGSRLKIDEVELNTIPERLQRKTEFLTHPVFNSYRSETDMMRYIKKLENRDLSLTRSMIPLGSCTMKLNAAAQLLPLTWPGFSALHPYVPADQAAGYIELISELEKDLADITGFAATSLQPNSGAQGEYAGLMVIRAYHEDRGSSRTKMLIPSSAHGTNPASAIMAGMDVVIVKVLENGNIDMAHLKERIAEYKDELSGIMVTYPSTNGIFESDMKLVQMFVI